LFAPISEVKFLQGKHIVEPFVVSVGFVYNEEGRASNLRNLTIEEYRQEKSRVAIVINEVA